MSSDVEDTKPIEKNAPEALQSYREIVRALAGDLLGQCRREVLTGDEPIGNRPELYLNRRRAADEIGLSPKALGLQA